MANFSKPSSMLSVLVSFFALAQFTTAFQYGSRHSHARGVDAAMHAQIDQVTEQLAQRDTARIAVMGTCAPGTSSNSACNSAGRQPAVRMEIRDLASNADQWNLFLLGMEAFQAMDKSDVLSYYQIAGIHGRPFVSWNGFATPLDNQAGFCPHGQVLFGSWHRPFLAAYEVCEPTPMIQ